MQEQKTQTARETTYMRQQEYWESLSKSFNSEFIERAKKEYEHQQRLQMA